MKLDRVSVGRREFGFSLDLNEASVEEAVRHVKACVAALWGVYRERGEKFLEYMVDGRGFLGCGAESLKHLMFDPVGIFHDVLSFAYNLFGDGLKIGKHVFIHRNTFLPGPRLLQADYQLNNSVKISISVDIPFCSHYEDYKQEPYFYWFSASFSISDELRKVLLEYSDNYGLDLKLLWDDGLVLEQGWLRPGMAKNVLAVFGSMARGVRDAGAYTWSWPVALRLKVKGLLVLLEELERAAGRGFTVSVRKLDRWHWLVDARFTVFEAPARPPPSGQFRLDGVRYGVDADDYAVLVVHGLRRLNSSLCGLLAGGLKGLLEHTGWVEGIHFVPVNVAFLGWDWFFGEPETARAACYSYAEEVLGGLSSRIKHDVFDYFIEFDVGDWGLKVRFDLGNLDADPRSGYDSVLCNWGAYSYLGMGVMHRSSRCEYFDEEEDVSPWDGRRLSVADGRLVYEGFGLEDGVAVGRALLAW